MKRAFSVNSLTYFCVMVLIYGLVSLGCGGSTGTNTNTALTSPTATPDLCSIVSDSMLVDMIMGRLLKDPDIAPEIKQINPIAKSGTVSLWGWLSDKTKVDKAVQIVGDTTCVRKPVNVDNFHDLPQPTGCQPPLIRCGDICSPEPCYWAYESPQQPSPTSSGKATSNSNSKMSTNTTGNTNSKMPSNANSNSKY